MPLSIRSCRVVARWRRQEEVGGGSLWLQDLSVGSVTFVGSLRPVSFRVASCVVYVKNKLISQVRSFFPCLFLVFFCLFVCSSSNVQKGWDDSRPTDRPNEHERTQTDIIPENSLSNENGLATRSATRNANQSPKRRNHGKTGCGRYGFTASLGLGN